MRSSYHFLFAGAPAQEKQRLLFSVLQQSQSFSQSERDFSFEVEQTSCSLSERSGPDETIPVLLRDAESLSGVILVVSASDCLGASFMTQVELIAALSVKLIAIVLVETERVSSLSMIEQELFQALRQCSLQESPLLLALSGNNQAEVARRLFQTLGDHVLLGTPPATKESKPMRLMLRARRQTINGREYALASLTQGTISIGDKVSTETTSYYGAPHTVHVDGLYDAYDLNTPLKQMRAEEEPTELFVAVNSNWWSALTGTIMTRAKALPTARSCQSILYLPAGGSQEIDPKQLTQIELTWGASNNKETIKTKLIKKSTLRPGDFALAELAAQTGSLIVQERFFTWYPTFAQRDKKSEGLGHIIKIEAR